MSRLEDWQLDMLDGMLNGTYDSGDFPPDNPAGSIMVMLPESWMKSLLEEIRASRASAGGGAEPKDELWEAVQKVGKSLQEDYREKRCPECGEQALDPELFVYCNECHEYREVK